MKSCLTCKKTFTDPNLSFCLDDGTPLISVAAPANEVSPSAKESTSIPTLTEIYKPRDWQAPDYQPPGFQPSTAAPTGKKTWPWVVGLLAALAIVVIGIGIAGAIFVPRMLRTASNRNSSNPSVKRGVDANSNVNSNAPVTQSNNESSDTEVDKDDATDDDITPPPTDKELVLATLRDLEQEWTVANINADKQKLNWILADDYTGMSAEGKVQGKAEYLRTVERDTVTQKWDFEDLKVTLMGDRASLDGVLRVQLPDQEVAYRFTDKFVWRDGRWQAVGSEVSRIK
ncbi:MAG: nuclear transport factor 2 family protein [Pyrinomonadaceae bacterium]|nr:nuclear transport factor 2 family protein [Pyrinomonadaceae bacterium]